MEQLYDVIKRPLITEKHMHFAEKYRQYAFEVRSDANKSEIKQAVERLFNVEVSSVNTMVVPGRRKRRRANIYKTPDWKKAIVTLKEGFSLDLV